MNLEISNFTFSDPNSAKLTQEKSKTAEFSPGEKANIGQKRKHGKIIRLLKKDTAKSLKSPKLEFLQIDPRRNSEGSTKILFLAPKPRKRHTLKEEIRYLLPPLSQQKLSSRKFSIKTLALSEDQLLNQNPCPRPPTQFSKFRQLSSSKQRSPISPSDLPSYCFIRSKSSFPDINVSPLDLNEV